MNLFRELKIEIERRLEYMGFNPKDVEAQIPTRAMWTAIEGAVSRSDDRVSSDWWESVLLIGGSEDGPYSESGG